MAVRFIPFALIAPIALVAATTLPLLGCQTAGGEGSAAAAPAAYQETGLASWYGPGLQGGSTASGEIFDQRAMTAAHPTLPLPSLVEVTNIESGEAVIVRINDRGPHVRGRIIDLSRAAADDLGFRSAGIAQVGLRYLGPAE